MNSRVSQLTSELRMIACFVEYVLWAGTEPSTWHGSSHLTFMTALWHTIIVSTIQRREFFGFQFLLLFSVAQLCPTLCDPVDCSTLGFPVLHYLPKFAQTHVHWIGDAIQSSHPLSPPPSPALNLSQHQGLFQWASSSHQVAKVLELQLQHQSFQWICRVDFI